MTFKVAWEAYNHIHAGAQTSAFSSHGTSLDALPGTAVPESSPSVRVAHSSPPALTQLVFGPRRRLTSDLIGWGGGEGRPGLSARAAQLSSPVRAHARGYSRARTVQALADGAPGRMQISKDDPSAFALGILGDLHMDPRDLEHSFEGREHMKAVLQVRVRPCLSPFPRSCAPLTGIPPWWWQGEFDVVVPSDHYRRLAGISAAAVRFFR
jgi:hypothetical protein